MTTPSLTAYRTPAPPTLPLPQHLDDPLSLYIHIPFCERRCIYCDFATVTGQEASMPAYVQAVIAEIDRRTAAHERGMRRAAQTVFFGGGTPSLLPVSLLRDLLNTVRDRFVLDPRAEVTMETNPGTITAESLRGAREAGINRISFGVQSLNDATLTLLGRIHTAAEAIEAVGFARAAGFENVSADLIYALPGQDLADWQRTLRGIVALDLPHLSLYALTAEEKTPLWRAIRRGVLSLPLSDEAADMYEWARDYLSVNGYDQYEISNWAKPGWESRHNMAYWVQTPYLGFGVSSHEFDGQERRANARGLGGYLRRVERGDDPVVFRETVDAPRARSDAMIFGLRLLEGIDRRRYAARYGADPSEIWRESIDLLHDLGLLEVSADRIALTRRAHLIGNVVWEHFL